MTRGWATAAIWLLVGCALLTPAGSRAEGLEISPVIIELSLSRRSEVITVRNGGKTPMRYQVSVFDWSESAAGESKLSPSSDLVVFPALFQLEPGDARKVRVGANVAPGAVERSWRVMVEELPFKVEKESSNRVVVRTRFALPAFLAPVAPRPAATMALRMEGGKLVASLQNGGATHIKPTAVRLTLEGERGATLHDGELAPWYVLAGGVRDHPFAVPTEYCAKVRRARVVATLTTGRVEASLDLPAGACAP